MPDISQERWDIQKGVLIGGFIVLMLASVSLIGASVYLMVVGREVIRYQRERPGELIHIDAKKLGRIAGIGHRITGHHVGMNRSRGIGWEHLHVAVDDASGLNNALGFDT